MNQQNTATPKEMLRAIRILFGAIIAGVLIFTVIVLALGMIEKQGVAPPMKEYENIALGIAIAIAVVCFIVAINGYNKAMITAKNSLISLPDKLNFYRSALIRYIALCDAPALLGVILLFITGNYLMLIITGSMLAAMLSKAPTHKRVTNELALDWKQQQELE